MKSKLPFLQRRAKHRCWAITKTRGLEPQATSQPYRLSCCLPSRLFDLGVHLPHQRHHFWGSCWWFLGSSQSSWRQHRCWEGTLGATCWCPTSWYCPPGSKCASRRCHIGEAKAAGVPPFGSPAFRPPPTVTQVTIIYKNTTHTGF